MTAETVNIPMNWKAAAGLIAITLENGNAQGVKSARAELDNMATAADRWNANAAALVELVQQSRALCAAVSPQSTGLADNVAAVREALAPFAELVPDAQPEPAPKTYTRTLEKKGARYVVTFDAEGVADTITRNGAPITSAHRDAQAILRAADSVLNRTAAPRGFTFAR